MRTGRLLFLVVFVAATGVARAGTITTPGSLDTAGAALLPRINAFTCRQLGLAATCTQAQASAVSSTATIYASVSALAVAVLTAELAARKEQMDAYEKALVTAAAQNLASPSNAQCAAVGLSNGCTATQIKDAACVAFGFAAGCLP